VSEGPGFGQRREANCIWSAVCSVEEPFSACLIKSQRTTGSARRASVLSQRRRSRHVSFEPQVRNLQQRLFDAYAANNDREIGKMIAEAMQKVGNEIIKVPSSTTLLAKQARSSWLLGSIHSSGRCVSNHLFRSGRTRPQSRRGSIVAIVSRVGPGVRRLAGARGPTPMASSASGMPQRGKKWQFCSGLKQSLADAVRSESGSPMTLGNAAAQHGV
jgi:hypothetical protein